MQSWTVSFLLLTSVVLAAPNANTEHYAAEARADNDEQRSGGRCLSTGQSCYFDTACCSGSCVGVQRESWWRFTPGKCVTKSTSPSPPKMVSTTRASSPTSTRATQTSSAMSMSLSSSGSASQVGDMTISSSGTGLVTNGGTSSTLDPVLTSSTTEPSSTSPVPSPPSPTITPPTNPGECLRTATRVIMIHTTVDFTSGELDRWTMTDVFTVPCPPTSVPCAPTATFSTETFTDRTTRSGTTLARYVTQTVAYSACPSAQPPSQPSGHAPGQAPAQPSGQQPSGKPDPSLPKCRP